MTALLVLFFGVAYLLGFLVTLAVGGWLLWEVKHYTNNAGERMWAFPERDDLFLVSFVVFFFWWLFAFPLLGFFALRLVVKAKVESVKREIEYKEWQVKMLTEQRKEMDQLAYHNQHRGELDLATINQKRK